MVKGTIKIKRDVEANRLAYTPEEGELIYTTNEKKVYIGDGATPGGNQLNSGGGIGESGLTANLDANNYRIEFVGSPVDNGDAVNLNYVTTNSVLRNNNNSTISANDFKIINLGQPNVNSDNDAATVKFVKDRTSGGTLGGLTDVVIGNPPYNITHTLKWTGSNFGLRPVIDGLDSDVVSISSSMSADFENSNHLIFIEATTNASISLSNNRSVCFWMKGNGEVVKNSSLASTSGFMSLLSTGKWRIQDTAHDGTHEWLIEGHTTNEWWFHCFVRDSLGVIHVYVAKKGDAQLVECLKVNNDNTPSSSIPEGLLALRALGIGYIGNAFNGQLDEYMFFNKELSQQEQNNLFLRASESDPIEGAMIYYKFNDLSDQINVINYGSSGSTNDGRCRENISTNYPNTNFVSSAGVFTTAESVNSLKLTLPLSLNGQSIVGTGVIGDANTVFYGNGSNLTGVSGGGDMVSDTTPELGGNLNAGNFSINNVNKLSVGINGSDDAFHVKRSVAGEVIYKFHNSNTDGEVNVLLSTSTVDTSANVGAKIVARRNNTGATGSTDLILGNSSGTNMTENITIKHNGITEFNDNQISKIKTATFNAEFDNANSGTAKTINFNNGQYQKVTMTGNCTFTFTNPIGISTFILKLIQDATGNRLATWPASVKWVDNTNPVLSTGGTATDLVSFYYDGTTYWGMHGRFN